MNNPQKITAAGFILDERDYAHFLIWTLDIDSQKTTHLLQSRGET